MAGSPSVPDRDEARSADVPKCFFPKFATLVLCQLNAVSYSGLWWDRRLACHFGQARCLSHLLFQLIAAYIYKAFRTQNVWINLGVSAFFIGPFNVNGAVFGRILPENADLYLDNIVLAQKASRLIGPATQLVPSRENSPGSV